MKSFSKTAAYFSAVTILGVLYFVGVDAVIYGNSPTELAKRIQEREEIRQHENQITLELPTSLSSSFTQQSIPGLISGDEMLNLDNLASGQTSNSNSNSDSSTQNSVPSTLDSPANSPTSGNPSGSSNSAPNSNGANDPNNPNPNVNSDSLVLAKNQESNIPLNINQIPGQISQQLASQFPSLPQPENLGANLRQNSTTRSSTSPNSTSRSSTSPSSTTRSLTSPNSAWNSPSPVTSPNSGTNLVTNVTQGATNNDRDKLSQSSPTSSESQHLPLPLILEDFKDSNPEANSLNTSGLNLGTINGQQRGSFGVDLLSRLSGANSITGGKSGQDWSSLDSSSNIPYYPQLVVEKVSTDIHVCLPKDSQSVFPLCGEYSYNGIKTDVPWLNNLILQQTNFYKMFSISEYVDDIQAVATKKLTKILENTLNQWGTELDLTATNHTYIINDKVELLAQQANIVKFVVHSGELDPTLNIPFIDTKHFYVDLTRRQLISLWEIFNQPTQIMYPIIQNELRQAICDSQTSSLNSCKSDEVNLDFKSKSYLELTNDFELTSEGLLFRYVDYYVGTHLHPPVDILIPATKILPYLKPFFANQYTQPASGPAFGPASGSVSAPTLNKAGV